MQLKGALSLRDDQVVPMHNLCSREHRILFRFSPPRKPHAGVELQMVMVPTR
jgi:hypothetical protein